MAEPISAPSCTLVPTNGRHRSSHFGDFTIMTTAARPAAAPTTPPSHLESSCWICWTVPSVQARRSVRKFQRLRLISSSSPERPCVFLPELPRTMSRSPGVSHGSRAERSRRKAVGLFLAGGCRRNCKHKHENGRRAHTSLHSAARSHGDLCGVQFAYRPRTSTGDLVGWRELSRDIDAR